MAAEPTTTGHTAHLFKKYAAVSETRDTFDSMKDYNSQMDITEFTRFARDFGITEVLTIAKLKVIFQNSNIGDSADDRRGYLNAEEFGGAISMCLERALGEFKRRNKPVCDGVLALQREVRDGPVRTPRRSAHSPKASTPKHPATEALVVQQASESQALAVPDANFQSDGVRVPVSKLWGAIREVESHIYTEGELRKQLDRLTVQYKAELEHVENEKAMTQKALEKTENELLEYERRVMSEMDLLEQQRDKALSDKDLSEQTCEALRAEREQTFQAMKDMKAECDRRVKEAREREDEMGKLLAAANTERDEAYEEARRMAAEKAEQVKRQAIAEENWQREMDALKARMEEQLARMIEERRLADEAAAAELKQVREDLRDEIDAQAARFHVHEAEIVAAHEAATAALKQDCEAQLLALQEQLKALNDTLVESNAAHSKKFAESEDEWKNRVMVLESEISSLKAENAELAGELERTKAAKVEVEDRLSADKERLYEQLAEERERREALASKLASMEAEALASRKKLQAEIEELLARAVKAETSLADALADVTSLEAQVVEGQQQLELKTEKITELEAIIAALHSELEDSKVKCSALEEQIGSGGVEFAEMKAQLESIIRTHEQTISNLEQKLQQLEYEADQLRDELRLEREAHSATRTERDTKYEEHAAELVTVKAGYTTQLTECKALHAEREQALQFALDEEKAEVARLTDELRVMTAERDQLFTTVEQLRADAAEMDELRAKLQSTISSLKEELSAVQRDLVTAEEARKSTEEKIITLERQHDHAIEMLTTKHQAELEDLQIARQKELEDLTTSHAKVVEELQRELSEIKAAHDKDINELTSAHEKEISDLQSAHQKTVEELVAAHQKEINELKSAREKEISDLTSAHQKTVAAHQKTVEDLEAARQKEIRELSSSHQQAMDELISAHQQNVDELTTEMRGQVTALQAEVTRLENLSTAQAASLEELEQSLAQLRMELRAEEKAHTITQHDLEAAKRELSEAQYTLSQKQVECDELRSQFENKCATILQLEADYKMLELANSELQNEVEKLQQQLKELEHTWQLKVDRLSGMLEDANECCETIEQRKELVDKQLSEKMIEVDNLMLENENLEETVETLKDANEEMYRESQKEIARLVNEMEEMKMQLTAKMRQLEDTLERVQRDRDELESAYQFAKDELGVIRTTLAAMEEGKQRVQYITEQPGNPTLVNRMNSEWGRVAGIPHIHLQDGAASPRRAPGSAFAREFRMAHSSGPSQDELNDAAQQGDFSRDHWRP